jgi:hypothetical protein
MKVMYADTEESRKACARVYAHLGGTEPSKPPGAGQAALFD